MEKSKVFVKNVLGVWFIILVVNDEIQVYFLPLGQNKNLIGPFLLGYQDIVNFINSLNEEKDALIKNERTEKEFRMLILKHSNNNFILVGATERDSVLLVFKKDDMAWLNEVFNSFEQENKNE